MDALHIVSILVLLMSVEVIDSASPTYRPGFAHLVHDHEVEGRLQFGHLVEQMGMSFQSAMYASQSSNSKLISFPPLAYNLTKDPNKGFLVEHVTRRYSMQHNNKRGLGLLILKTPPVKFGQWYYNVNKTGWQTVPHKSSRTRGNQQNVIRLGPNDTLKFELISNHTFWGQSESRLYAYMMFSVWDGSDGESAGPGTINARDGTYNHPVMGLIQRLGCNGQPGSKARIDRCGICGGRGLKCLGCDGVPFSGARYDQCGKCTGGTTNKTFNYLKDCAGLCGKAKLDECGICQSISKTKYRRNFMDCAGVCFGTARIDRCNVCAGGNTTLKFNDNVDACGVCNGTNSTCTGCDGVPNSGKKIDYCGECWHPFDAQYNANCTKMVDFLPKAAASDGDVKIAIIGAGFHRFKNAECVFSATFNGSGIGFPAVPVNLSSYNKNGFFITSPQISVGTYTLQCTFDNGSRILEAKNKTIRFYTKPSLRVYNVTPSRVPINTEMRINVTGDGFTDTGNVHCVGFYYGYRIYMPANVTNLSSLFCIVPKVKWSIKLSITVVLSKEDANFLTTPKGAFNIIEIYSPPPRPLKAKLSSNLRHIFVDFSSNIYIRTTRCYELLDKTFAKKLGFGSKCYMKTPKQMVIMLGRGASVLPTDTLSFLPGGIYARHQKLSNHVTGSLIVEAPSRLLPPELEVTAPKTVGTCDSVRVFAKSSGNSGGKSLRFSWTVDFSPDTDNNSIDFNATADLQRIRSYLTSLPSHTHGVYLKPTMLLARSDDQYLGYKFTVTVSNFMGQTANDSVVVSRRHSNVPTILIPGGKIRKIRASGNNVIRAFARHSACIKRMGISPPVDFRWEIDPAEITLDPQSSITSRLLLKRGQLKGGNTYTLTVTGSLQNDPSIFSTAKVTLEVKDLSLMARIKGGNRIVGENSNLILDGSKSYDPNRDTSTKATYLWECTDKNGEACLVRDSQNNRYKRLQINGTKRVLIPKGTLQGNETYVFTLNYRKGQRAVQTSVSIKVVEGRPPEVVMRPQRSSKANPDRILTVSGYVTATMENTRIWWESVDEDGSSYLNISLPGVTYGKTEKIIRRPGVRWSHLVIRRGQLDSGVSYKFRLNANNSNGHASSDVVIQTNGPPTAGILSVSPSNGTALQTVFTFSAVEGWTDDVEDLPLIYSFGYVRNNGKIRHLGTPSVDSEASFRLPQGRPENGFNVTVFVDVRDNRRATTRVYQQVTVTPMKNLTIYEVVAFKQSIEEAFAVDDMSSAISQITSTLTVLNEAGKNTVNQIASVISNMAEVQKYVMLFKQNMTVSVLEKVLMSVDRETQDAVLEAFPEITVDGTAFESDILKRLATTVSQLVMSQNAEKKTDQVQSRRRRSEGEDEDEEGDEIEEEGRSSEEVEPILETFNNIIDPRANDTNTMYNKKKFRETVDTLLQTMCKRTKYEEDASSATSKLAMLQSYKYDFSDAENASISLNCANCTGGINGDVNATLGKELESKYQSWQCSQEYSCNGACIGSVQYPDDLFADDGEYNRTRISGVISMALMNPETGEKLNPGELKEPVTFTIPVNPSVHNTSYNSTCKRWDESTSAWTSQGCLNTVEDGTNGNGTFVICKCMQIGAVAAFRVDEIRTSKLEGTNSTNAPVATNAPNTTNANSGAKGTAKVKLRFPGNYTTIIGKVGLQSFKDSMASAIASSLGIPKSRIINMQVSSGSILVTFDLTEPSTGSDKVTVKQAIDSLGNKVKAGTFVVTLSDGSKLTGDRTFYEATIVGATGSSPKAKKDKLLPLYIAVGVVGAIIIGVGGVFLFKKFKTPQENAPPARAHVV